MGGWVDRREVRFYVVSFVMFCLIAASSYSDPVVGLALLVGLAGCGPVVWRFVV
jgi:hypothetical protein